MLLCDAVGSSEKGDGSCSPPFISLSKHRSMRGAVVGAYGAAMDEIAQVQISGVGGVGRLNRLVARFRASTPRSLLSPARYHSPSS